MEGPLGEKHVAHRVLAGGLVDEPFRGSEGAPRKYRSVLRPMGQLQPLAFSREEDRVFADNRATPHHLESDFVVRAWSDLSVSPPFSNGLKVEFARPRRRLAKEDSGSAGCVHFVFMVGLEDFDIKSLGGF